MGLLISAHDKRAMASGISVAAGIGTAVLLVWMVVGVRERPEYQGRGESKPFKAFGDVFRNPHARILLVVFLIESLGGATIGVLTPYVAQYIVGTPEKTSLYILTYAVPSALSVPFWVAMSRRFGKKRLWILSMLVTAFGFGAMFLLREGDVLLIMVLALLLGLGAGAGAVVAPSIEADVIDYDELATGQRKEGAYFAAWNFVFKSATGVTLMVTGLVLDLAGFAPNEVQSDEAKLALLSLYALFPMACYLIGTLIFTRFSLDEAEHARIRRALDERASG
jgi:GPH family glycoside/pentoside/hexuronide:cation symporter